MAIAKRIVLFILVNILVVTVISFLLSIFNVQPFLNSKGLDFPSLAIFCLIWGMGGAIISLLLSKIMAKWMMGVQIIDPNTRDPNQAAILQSVYEMADKAGLPAHPEVGYYNSPEVNAFATGPSKRNSLVAVSTGLLQRMRKEEIDGVLGHEITHIANGDMVTMTLLQGVVNAFVMFLARIIAFAVSRAMSGKREGESNSSGLFHMITFVLQTVFMILGSVVIASFSRYREFRADAGGARLAGPANMIAALQALKRTFNKVDTLNEKPAFQALKISSNNGIMKLFASHPPLDERIEKLQRLYK